MARVTAIKNERQYSLWWKALGEHAEDAATTAIRAGSEVLADAIRQDYSTVLSKNSTGQMMKHMGITPVKYNSKGWWDAKIGFYGYDVRKPGKWTRGVPHLLKARVLESGTKDGRVKGHGIFQRVLQAEEAAVREAMQNSLNKSFKEEFKWQGSE